MHKLLQRQLAKAIRRSGTDQPDMDYLLQLISDSYSEADKEHRLAGRAAKLMEEELISLHRERIDQARQYFETVLSRVGDGVLFLDNKLRIQNGNRQAEILLDHPLELLQQHTLNELFTQAPDLDQRQLETRIIHNNTPVELVLSQLNYNNQQESLLIIRDISERVAVQDKLRQSKSMFRDFAESSSDWFWETDSKHRLTSITGFTPVLKRLDRDNMIGRSRMELMRNAPPDLFEQHIDDLNAHRPFRDLEYELESNDDPIFVSVSGKPRFDNKGNFIGYRGTARDITELRKTDAYLAQIENRLSTAISSINEGIALFDQDDQLVLFNERTKELYPEIADKIELGVSYSDLIQALVKNKALILPSDPETWLKYQSDKETRYTVRINTVQTSDGRYIKALEYPTPDGGTVGIYSDVTDTQRLQEQLRAEKERAEFANQAKSEFLANMSHEIRTPMNAIIGLSHLALLSAELSGEQKEYLDKIHYASKQLLGILNDILDFSKIEAGKLSIEPQHFELSELIKHTDTLLKPLLMDRPIEYQWQIPPETPKHYFGDLLRINQILANLTSNAVKFTEQGRILITLSCQSAEGSAPEPIPSDIAQAYPDATGIILSISVDDTGIGISREKQAQLFTAFTQADASITRQFGGTGLGLAISKRLCEMMQGDLTVNSNPGVGSCFTATLKLWALSTQRYSDSPPKPELTALNTLKQPLPTQSNTEAQVLLVEDNSINQMVAGRFLKKIGIQFELAENGEQALEMIRQTNYQLILMDLQMPVMDGLTATNKIREELGLNELPIIAMTANAMQGDRERCLEAGMSDYLSKPIDFAALREKLEHWLAIH